MGEDDLLGSDTHRLAVEVDDTEAIGVRVPQEAGDTVVGRDHQVGQPRAPRLVRPHLADDRPRHRQAPLQPPLDRATGFGVVVLQECQRLLELLELLGLLDLRRHGREFASLRVPGDDRAIADRDLVSGRDG